MVFSASEKASNWNGRYKSVSNARRVMMRLQSTKKILKHKMNLRSDLSCWISGTHDIVQFLTVTGKLGQEFGVDPKNLNL